MRRKIVMIIFQQHKAFCCYVLLSLWIFITVISLYRYLGVNDSKIPNQSAFISEKPHIFSELSSNIWITEKRFKKIYKSCNPLESISVGSESPVLDSFSLEGVIIIFRHGDRGPLNHVRNLDSINCNHNIEPNSTALYNDYISFIMSFWSNQVLSNLYQFYGQQNNHPPVPNSKHCELGQLTSAGVMQHLKLGSELRKVYYNALFDNSTQIHHNVFAYTTKYRRTFQSLNAFLYGFLRQKFYKIPLYTSNSMNYCFEDCTCSAANVYNKLVLNENSKRLKSHPAIAKLIEDIAAIIYTMSDHSFSKDPHYMKDALLTYICHNSQLPCSISSCLHPEHVTRVFAYIDWDIRQFAKSLRRYKFSLLTAYGFFKNIILHLLKIVSNESPKLVIYSAHDKTLQYLLTALGITSNEAVSPPYASRAIFEIYGSKQTNISSSKKFYFRILFDGKDLTNPVKFCAEENVLTVSQNNLKIFLCSFESLIRFLHDDYFSIFNSANFKDSCMPTKS